MVEIGCINIDNLFLIMLSNTNDIFYHMLTLQWDVRAVFFPFIHQFFRIAAAESFLISPTPFSISFPQKAKTPCKTPCGRRRRRLSLRLRGHKPSRRLPVADWRRSLLPVPLPTRRPHKTPCGGGRRLRLRGHNPSCRRLCGHNPSRRLPVPESRRSHLSVPDRR